jgi:hypothetical protein
MKSRWLRVGLVGLLVLGVLAPVFTGSGGTSAPPPIAGASEPPTVPLASLDSSITEELARRGHDVTVSCPPDRPGPPGGTFACSATTADGTPLAITVTRRDAHNNVSWGLDGIVLDTRAVITELQPKLPASAVITCPQRTVQLAREGDIASCRYRDGAQLAQLVIRFADARTGRVTANLAP